MSEFYEISPESLDQSPFRLIGKDWMLVAAQSGGKTNAMTASWGGMGVMWGKNVAFVVIRPQRYTKEFVDQSTGFSLTFYPDGQRKMLNYMGTVSGRDEDKIAASGLTLAIDGEIPYFTEAKLAIFCKKLYAQKYDPSCFIENSLDKKWYPDADYHTLYIAEIQKILVKK